MSLRRISTTALILLWMLHVSLLHTTAGPPAEKDVPPATLEVTSDIKLNPNIVYGSIIVKKSGVTIDGQGAGLVGVRESLVSADQFTGIGIFADGVSNVTLRNVNAKGWETGLLVRNAKNWTITDCDFSDNFHDPQFGWGENGRRGGIVLEQVQHSKITHNKANRVWDACVLVDSNDNTVEANDFSHTSNTCLKLWTSSRNVVRENILSHGIRISPGEVHARDSTSVLIESGSNNNRFTGNDCTHGGDGIFVRVLNGWCSTGNYFENNDCSFANNNGIECWAPRNIFIRNKANHCSYGFWLGGSDQTQLIQNEASFNGLATGHHNSPHLPENGHAGIVFMFGPSSHIVACGNTCQGNNGAGIALIGDLESQGKKWKAYHWIIEGNNLAENRWGLFAQHADWITVAGNVYRANSVKDVFVNANVTRLTESTMPIPETHSSPEVKVAGPTSVHPGVVSLWEARTHTKTPDDELSFTWDVGDGKFRTGPTLEHTFARTGFHRIGLNVTDGLRTSLAWHHVYVVRDTEERGTEDQLSSWMIEDFHDRARSHEQISRAAFESDTTERLVGNSSLKVTISPYAGFRAALTYPKSRDAQWSLKGRKKVTFWLKSINEDVTGWQGGPFLVIHGAAEQSCFIEPREGRDLMRELDHNEAREGWRLFEIPLDGDDRWQRHGELPETVKAITLAFDSWGAPPLQIWIDGLAIE